jgi:hypothetical protein
MSWGTQGPVHGTRGGRERTVDGELWRQNIGGRWRHLPAEKWTAGGVDKR